MNSLVCYGWLLYFKFITNKIPSILRFFYWINYIILYVFEIVVYGPSNPGISITSILFIFFDFIKVTSLVPSYDPNFILAYEFPVKYLTTDDFPVPLKPNISNVVFYLLI